MSPAIMLLHAILRYKKVVPRQAVNDSTLAPVSYTVFIPALTQP